MVGKPSFLLAGADGADGQDGKWTTGKMVQIFKMV